MINGPRKAIQWTVICLMVIFAIVAKLSDNFTVDFEAYCPFGGIQSLGSYLLNNALSCTMTGVQIVMGITLIFAVITLSKLFCAFICPLGTISEWLGRLGQRLKAQVTIKGIADIALRSVKYILLFITLYHTLQSNELFCKKYDPFFGVSSGFNSDVVVLYSVIAIVTVIIGSVFIRLFWCKYICPLGAISNIFKFSGFFTVVLAIYLLLLKVGVEISYVWPLAAACLGGYLIEVTKMHGKVFPLVKVTRNDSSCVNCKLCSKRCPQAIDVANLTVVREADCNLCGDCVSICPEENTLQFNKKKGLRYLPHIATIVLVLVGMLMGQLWHIPTINQRWVDFDAYENVKTYSRSGLSSVKCYGSCAAFANKMRKIDGVLGVSTYVDTKTAKVYYDASQISEENIDRAIFTPQKIVLRQLKAEESGVRKIHVTLENFFDKNDFNYLARYLQDNTDAVGLISEFGCPVIVEVYFPNSNTLSDIEITDLLEVESFKYTYKEKEYTAELDYEVMSGPEETSLDKEAYAKVMFVPVSYQFNNRELYTKDVTSNIILKSPLNGKNRSKVKYLISHISNDNGVIEFRSLLNDENEEVIDITIVDSLTTVEDVKLQLKSDTLEFNYKNGRIGKVANMFHFD